jgi:hypothetical protein
MLAIAMETLDMWACSLIAAEKNGWLIRARNHSKLSTNAIMIQFDDLILVKGVVQEWRIYILQSIVHQLIVLIPSHRLAI